MVGFPCNQFGAQEPGTAAEIQTFCSVNFGVTFPLSAKIEVNGPHRHPLYAWLTAPENGFPGDIGWNFEKFLIDRGGRVVCRYPAGTKPTDPAAAGSGECFRVSTPEFAECAEPSASVAICPPTL